MVRTRTASVPTSGQAARRGVVTLIRGAMRPSYGSSPPRQPPIPPGSSAPRCAAIRAIPRRVGHAPALASSRASRRLLWVQMSLLVAMQRGWCYLTGDRPVRTAMYLRALHRLSRFLLTVQRTPLYRQALTPHLQDVFFAPGFP